MNEQIKKYETLLKQHIDIFNKNAQIQKNVEKSIHKTEGIIEYLKLSLADELKQNIKEDVKPKPIIKIKKTTKK